MYMCGKDDDTLFALTCQENLANTLLME